MLTSSSSVKKAALNAGAKWPELVTAQWHLESAQGAATSGKNNFFGLKGNGSNKQTTEYINGIAIKINDDFIDFASPEECINYLVSRWYKDWNGYKGVNNATTAEDAARMLQSEGYATDPEYANKLIRVMAQYNQQSPSMTSQSTIDYVDLIDVPENYKGLQHQVKALHDLNTSLTKEQREQFTKTWRTEIKETAPTTKANFPLNVPYFYQRDSRTGNGERMCQSSSIAMRIEQIDPSLIGDDDSYLQIVKRFGDTVSQSAQHQALSYLNLKNEFRQDGTEELLCKLLDQGIAVPIGILHKGNISNPSGGGHWIILTGYDQEYFYCHDPFGELDLINGGYPKAGPTDGKNQRYTRKNLMKRWLISSKSDGWLWVIQK
jgi:hypothetical protein